MANSSALDSKTKAEEDFVAALGHWAAGRRPLYEQLEEAIAGAIRRGELQVGRKLPTERRLVSLLRVSRTTIVAAYRALAVAGLVTRRQGSGTFVTPRVQPPQRERLPASVTVLHSMIDGDGDIVDLSMTGLGAEEIIRADHLAAAAEHLACLTTSPGYHPYGVPALRAAVAERLAEHGLATAPEQLLITNGAQQALHLVAQLLVRSGDAVALENPTYAGALDVFTGCGADLLALPTPASGATGSRLRELRARRPLALAYVMPTFHNPTGEVMPTETRRELAALAADGLWVVEDHALSSFPVERPTPPPLAGLGDSATVITLGSLSKAIWGGLRIGWIRAAPAVVDRFARMKTVADLGTSVPSQALALALLADFERVLAAHAAKLRASLDAACDQFAAILPEWEWTRPAGGHSIWLRLPRGDADAFVQVALRHGVKVVSGSLLACDRSCADYLRLQFLQEPGVVREGLARLARAWEAFAALEGRPRGVIV